VENRPIPEYLYHYTSISSLGLILKNRTLKFNSLLNMDDLEEAKANDLKEYGKYCFVSSWTDSDEEKISLWSMYTYNMSGVRIKMHKLPFETYTYKINKPGLDITSIDNFFPEHFWGMDKCVPIYYPNEKFVERIEYTDDEKLIYPDLLKYNKETDQTTLALNLLGKYKRKEWNFQDEIRYKIIFFPFTLKECYDLEIAKRNISQQIDLPFDSCFLQIKDEYFNEVEITKGPKMNNGDSEILDLIVNTYCPTAKISESKFKNKIR